MPEFDFETAPIQVYLDQIEKSQGFLGCPHWLSFAMYSELKNCLWNSETHFHNLFFPLSTHLKCDEDNLLIF